MIDKMAKGIIHLFPACIWTIGLAGVILASWWNGGSRIVQSGACLLLCVGLVTLEQEADPFREFINGLNMGEL